MQTPGSCPTITSGVAAGLRDQILSDELLAAVAPPEDGFVEIRDYAVPGLRVRIKSTGIITFILRKRSDGRVRSIQIGHFQQSGLNLGEARRRALAIVGSIEMPEATSWSVSDQFDRYIEAKRAMRSLPETERIFRRHILPHIGSRSPHTISRAEITALIDLVRGPYMARAVAAQLSAFFNWLMPRSDLLASNPCESAAKPRAPASRDRILTAEELAALWEVLLSDGSQFAIGAQLLALTLQRRNEVFGADCSEIDFANALWTLPPRRTKNGRVHSVPLSEDALSLFEKQARGRKSGLLFASTGISSNPISGFSKAWNRIRRGVDEKLGRPVPRFTMHDLRRTGATGLQRLELPTIVIESVLNHVSGQKSGIVGVYQRYDFASEKSDALAKWQNELRRITQREVLPVP